MRGASVRCDPGWDRPEGSSDVGSPRFFSWSSDQCPICHRNHLQPTESALTEWGSVSRLVVGGRSDANRAWWPLSLASVFASMEAYRRVGARSIKSQTMIYRARVTRVARFEAYARGNKREEAYIPTSKLHDGDLGSIPYIHIPHGEYFASSNGCSRGRRAVSARVRCHRTTSLRFGWTGYMLKQREPPSWPLPLASVLGSLEGVSLVRCALNQQPDNDLPGSRTPGRPVRAIRAGKQA